jgi:hypothetical protein
MHSEMQSEAIRGTQGQEAIQGQGEAIH